MNSPKMGGGPLAPHFTLAVRLAFSQPTERAHTSGFPRLSVLKRRGTDCEIPSLL